MIILLIMCAQHFSLYALSHCQLPSAVQQWLLIIWYVSAAQQVSLHREHTVERRTSPPPLYSAASFHRDCMATRCRTLSAALWCVPAITLLQTALLPHTIMNIQLKVQILGMSLIVDLLQDIVTNSF